MNDIPTAAEFLQACREEFRFLQDDFGFKEVACLRPNPFCVRFASNDRALEVRGEGYGATAACHVSYGDLGPLSLIYLVPEEYRPRRSRKRDRMNQLDHVRERAQLARQDCADFLAGDVERFVRVWEANKEMFRRLERSAMIPEDSPRTRRGS